MAVDAEDWLRQFDQFRDFINRSSHDSNQQAALIGSLMVGMGLALVEVGQGREAAVKMAYLWADNTAAPRPQRGGE